MLNFDPVSYRVQIYCELEMRGMEEREYIPLIAEDMGIREEVLARCLRAPYWDSQVCFSSMRVLGVEVPSYETDEEFRLTDEDREVAFLCMDCGVNTQEINEYYMLQNDLWYDITSHTCGRGMLCLGCVEHRLERQLEPVDFRKGVPVNEGFFPQSERFLDRIGK